MKRFAISFFVLILPFVLHAQVIPTTEWINIWGDSVTFNAQHVPVGSVVKAYDPFGVLCGEFVVALAGGYGLMPVYRDDPLTLLIDEGAEPGDTLFFTIDDIPAVILGPDLPVWTFNGDVQKVNLSYEMMIPTSEWISLWSDATEVGGSPVETGAVIQARDPQGVLCGEFVVKTDGTYGLMSVYRDDPLTLGFDEGAEPGDGLFFTINGAEADEQGPDAAVWTGNGDVLHVDLNVETVPVMFQTACLQCEDDGVSITWVLHEAVDKSSCTLFRRSGNDERFIELANVKISQEGPVYSVIDTEVVPGEQYQYRLRVRHAGGLVTADLGSIEVPALIFAFYQNNPNPFQYSTTFVYKVVETASVSLVIYDVRGHLVRRLIDHEMHQPGSYHSQWDGRSDSGMLVAKGVYFARCKVGSRHAIRKLTVLR